MYTAIYNYTAIILLYIATVVILNTKQLASQLNGGSVSIVAIYIATACMINLRRSLQPSAISVEDCTFPVPSKHQLHRLDQTFAAVLDFPA